MWLSRYDVLEDRKRGVQGFHLIVLMLYRGRIEQLLLLLLLLRGGVRRGDV